MSVTCQLSHQQAVWTPYDLTTCVYTLQAMNWVTMNLYHQTIRSLSRLRCRLWWPEPEKLEHQQAVWPPGDWLFVCAPYRFITWTRWTCALVSSLNRCGLDHLCVYLIWTRWTYTSATCSNTGELIIFVCTFQVWHLNQMILYFSNLFEHLWTWSFVCVPYLNQVNSYISKLFKYQGTDHLCVHLKSL